MRIPVCLVSHYGLLDQPFLLTADTSTGGRDHRRLMIATTSIYELYQNCYSSGDRNTVYKDMLKPAF